MSDGDDEVLDVLAASKLLRTGKDAIYTACGRGQLPHRRIGKKIRFSKRALLRWLEGAVSEVPVQEPELTAKEEETLRKRAHEHAERMKRARVTPR